MKKLLTILALALALCLICGLASAEVKFNNGYILDYGAKTEYDADTVTVKKDSKINVSGVVSTVKGLSKNLDEAPASTLTFAWSKDICNKPVQLVIHYKTDGGENHQKVETVVLFQHRYPDLTNDNAKTLIKAATCTEDGQGKFKCERCGHIETLTIPAMGHNPVEVIDEPANCSENGKAHKECSRCHIIIEPQYAKVGGHLWVTLWNDPQCEYGVKDTTWGARGYWTTKCAYCGLYASKGGNPVFDTDANATPNSGLGTLPYMVAGVNKFECASLADYNAQRTAYGLEEISGHAWDWDIWTYVAPTCVEAGYKIRWCSRCHEDERVKLNKNELKLPEYKDWDKPLGPDWELVLRDDALWCNFEWPDKGTCSEAYIVCSICGGTQKSHKIVNSKETAEDKMGVKYTVTYTKPADLKKSNMKGTFNVTPSTTNVTTVYGAKTVDSTKALAVDVTHVYKQEAKYAVLYVDGTPLKSVPTCETNGYVYYRCVYSPVTDATAVTFAANGIDIVSAAAHAIDTVQYANKLDHDWKPWIEEYPATEDHTGWWHRDCQRRVTTQNLKVWTCPAHQDEHLMYKPCEKHVAKKVIDVPAKCGVEGAQHWECAECGAPMATPEGESKVIPALDHVWNAESAWTIKEAATCTKDGVAIKECTLCHIYKEDTVKKTGHALTLVPGEKATHTKEGKKDSYLCSNCGKIFADEKGETEVKAEDLIIAKTPEHDWDNAKVEIVKEATCKEAGKKLLTCECGATKTIAIPMIAHTPEEIPAVEPTCKTVGATAGKKCSACGTVLEAPVEIPVDLTKHVWGEVVETKAPTCEKAGAGLKVCTVCKTSEEVVIPAKGHDWGEWEVTTPATLEKDGEETRVCKNDATHKETRPVKFVPTAPAKYEVKDLDYTNPVATGSVELDPETKALTKAYARVTFFVANGDCMIQIVDVDEAGSFTAGAIGNFTHVSVIIVDDADAYGADEAIEHAHGNGGIEL